MNPHGIRDTIPYRDEIAAWTLANRRAIEEYRRPRIAPRTRFDPDAPNCSQPNCEHNPYRRGLCRKHYRHARKAERSGA